jgi:hypothetical protein
VVAGAELAASRSYSAEPLAPAEWEAVAAVEERAHSDHDALSRPSEKSHIYLIHIFEGQGSSTMRESKGETDRFLHNHKGFHMAQTFLLKLRLTPFINHTSKRVYHDYINSPKDSRVQKLS